MDKTEVIKLLNAFAEYIDEGHENVRFGRRLRAAGAKAVGKEPKLADWECEAITVKICVEDELPALLRQAAKLLEER
jgi:hypothetical protein